MREPSHTSPEADDIGEDREQCDVDRQHDHPSVRATRLARRAPVVKSASRALDGDQGRGAGGQRFLELLFRSALDAVLGELGEQRTGTGADGCRGEQRRREQTDYEDERVARGT